MKLLKRLSRPLASATTLAILTTVAALTAPSAASAAEVGQFRLGALLGQVGLSGDPGSGGNNAIGLGVLGGFRLDDQLALDIQFLSSSHSRVDHRELSVGADYYLGDYEKASPHISVGMTFNNNRFKDASFTGDAAGLYIGGGLEFELNPGLTIGPEVRYQKAFEATAKINNVDTKTVQDSYSLLLRLLYQFGND